MAVFVGTFGFTGDHLVRWCPDATHPASMTSLMIKLILTDKFASDLEIFMLQLEMAEDW